MPEKDKLKNHVCFILNVMKEIEIKFLEVNQKMLVARLKKLGAKKEYDGKLDAYFFDYTGNTLKQNNLLLRLRKKSSGCELTLKKKYTSKKAKICDEYEVLVSDENTTLKILELLGLQITNHLTKSRVSYMLDGVHFEFDTYPNVPTYLEIETHKVKELPKIVKLLGLDISDAKVWSGNDVLKYYKKFD